MAAKGIIYSEEARAKLKAGVDTSSPTLSRLPSVPEEGRSSSARTGEPPWSPRTG